MTNLKTKALMSLLSFIMFASASNVQSEEILQIVYQGSYFTLKAQTTVKYGAQNLFNQKILQPGTYNCNDSFFGDPIKNVFKSCYEVKNITGSLKISDQFGTFEIFKDDIVSYGANGLFFQKFLKAGRYLCNDKLFGDPIVGTVKACFLNNPQTSPIRLAVQHGTFELVRPTLVSYGINGTFFSRTLQSGTYSCDDKLFGDPLLGVIKECYVAALSDSLSDSGKAVVENTYSGCDD